MTSDRPTETKSAIIFGATGAVGKPLLAQLLSSTHHSNVHAFVRRPFKEASPFKEESRLQEHVIDFDKLIDVSEGSHSAHIVHTIKSIGASSVYITLGTTRAVAGSAADFVKIDQDYVVAAARAARSEKTADQRLIYCSSAGANEKSRFLYLQSKGATERKLAELAYPECIVFRPSYLSGAQRERTKVTEKIFGSLMTNICGRISKNAEIQVNDVAKALALAGTKGIAGVATALRDTPIDKAEAGGPGSKPLVVNNLQTKELAKQG